MIRTALVGVGNCSSSLVQAIHLSRHTLRSDGIAYPVFGNYRVGDIDVVAAYDVDSRKVGKDLAEAIFADPNCATKFTDVPSTGVKVAPGPRADGVSAAVEQLEGFDPVDDVPLARVVDELTRCRVEVLVIYLPVGAHEASRLYAAAAIEAKCALVNCTPAPLASDAEWAREFSNHGLPLLGDDVRSQFGSTAFHRSLIGLILRRGGSIDESYQLNAGGNTDFLNMRQPSVAAHKRHTKRTSLEEFGLDPDKLSVGPSDYISHLGDHKVAYINIVGRGMMGARISVELKLEVEDSPNSAGVVVDAIRAARIALDRRRSGPIAEPCAALFKNPPDPLPDTDAFAALDLWAAPINEPSL